jgi:hypothetical protein
VTGGGRRFDPSELRNTGEPETSAAELAEMLGAARELEAMASSDGIRPTDGFEDRVMAAIATEPAPRVAIRSGSAVRGGRPVSLLLAVRDAWGVAGSGGRPLAVRAQALALVLLVVVALGSVLTAGAVTVGGMLNGTPSHAPSFEPGPSATPAPTAEPTPSTSPTETAEPAGTAEPTETSDPTETAEPDHTAKPTATPTNGAGETARPTRTPRPTDTPEPTKTPEPTDDSGGGGGGSGSGGPGPG